MKISTSTIELETKGEFDINDITDQVEQFISDSEIENGIINIHNFHSSAALLLNINESCFLEDLKKHMHKLAPKGEDYKHNDFDVRTDNMTPDESFNGHSHCQAIHYPTNLTLNIVDGKLQLGTWQRILFIELDNKRPRKIQLQLIGQ
jgi:secondary thiamine-phosphate synthase enzyme